ncbi:MAG: hypothetical protein ACR2PH_02155, partial [Desulfobulbia bacterium]
MLVLKVPNGRFGSCADNNRIDKKVRFTRKSGHKRDRTECPLMTVGSNDRRNTSTWKQGWGVWMGYGRRIYFTEKQKAEIWDRWQRGGSMSSIGRLFDRNSSSIYPLLARTGGIRLPERRRSRLALTLAEREEISRG